MCNQDKCVYSFVYIHFFSDLNSHRPFPPSAFQERCNFFLIILMLLVLPPLLLSVLFCLIVCSCAAVYKNCICGFFFFFFAADEPNIFLKNIGVCHPLCQMAMMTQRGSPGCLPRPPVKTWHHPHRCPMAAVTSAWPQVARRKEVLACRTPASSVTSPSGINSPRLVSMMHTQFTVD